MRRGPELRGPELRALTGVRGLAAWLVVLYHIRQAPDWLPRSVVDALGKGYLAVDFFFLLSGFVIWLAWHQRLRDQGLRTVPGFLQRRIARIWPLHLAMLGFGVLLAGVLAATGRADPVDFPVAELPLHLALVQNWGFTGALAWNDPAWSISSEWAAYLAFPLLAFAIDWRRVPTPVVLAAIVALLALLHQLFAASGAATLNDAIPRLGVVRCLCEFTSGGAVAALWLRWRDRPGGVAPVAAIAAIAAVVALGTVAGGLLPETFAIPLAFAALLLALALTSQRRGNPLGARWLHALGEASYATYLSHYLLWTAFKLAFVTDATAVPAPTIAAYLALVLGASFALYHWVERPAQAWINRLRLPARASVAPETA